MMMKKPKNRLMLLVSGNGEKVGVAQWGGYPCNTRCDLYWITSGDHKKM